MMIDAGVRPILAAPCYDPGMPASAPHELPGISWTEDAYLVVPQSERKLRRWGSVEQACKMLDECGRETIYDLIAVKAIKAYKRRPHRPNSHWRVDLLSVWEHKQRQLAA